MGGGIAQVVAASGRHVSLYDAAPGAAERALETMRKSLAKLAEKGAPDPDEVLARVTIVDDLVPAALMIEAVVEDADTKEDVFRRADLTLAPAAILASNTSSIPISSLAAATNRPDKAIGMHFFNPVPVLKLVEIVRGRETSDETAGAITAFAEELGKTPAVANDFPGFVSNRILMPYINEAVHALDDDPGLRALLRATLDAVDVEVDDAADAAVALTTIRRRRPDAIVLDVNLPGLDGLSFCRQLKRERATRDIPIVVLTVSALATALETKDTGTRAHSQRVQRYAVELTKAVDPDLIDDQSTEYGFLLHDVGKIGIPDDLLLKPGPLTQAERRRMETHTVLGEQMLRGVAFLHGEGLRVVRSHHERWDGTGYPDGIGGTDIPLGARIFAVADALDAMTSDRPYRKAMSWAAAGREILSESRRQFDPQVVEAFTARERSLRAIRREFAALAA